MSSLPRRSVALAVARNSPAAQSEKQGREYAELSLQLAELTAALDQQTAAQREEALQAEIEQRNQQALMERLRAQLSASQSDHKKLLSDFEEFKTRARTVLRQKQEGEPPVEDIAALKARVRSRSAWASSHGAQIEQLDGQNRELSSRSAELQASCGEYETELQLLLDSVANLKSAGEMAKLLAEEQIAQLRGALDGHERESAATIQRLRFANTVVSLASHRHADRSCSRCSARWMHAASMPRPLPTARAATVPACSWEQHICRLRNWSAGSRQPSWRCASSGSSAMPNNIMRTRHCSRDSRARSRCRQSRRCVSVRCAFADRRTAGPGIDSGDASAAGNAGRIANRARRFGAARRIAVVAAAGRARDRAAARGGGVCRPARRAGQGTHSSIRCHIVTRCRC